MAGGIFLLLSAIDMFSGIARGKSITDNYNSEEKEDILDIATFPLATPLLLGPGTITLLLTFAHESDQVGILSSAFLALIASGFILLLGIYLKNLLRDSGVKLLSRLMALIVASVAIEFIHATLLIWGIASN